MSPKIYYFIFLLTCRFFLAAQDTQVYRAEERMFKAGLEAFEQKAFGSAESLFKQYLDLENRSPKNASKPNITSPSATATLIPNSLKINYLNS